MKPDWQFYFYCYPGEKGIHKHLPNTPNLQKRILNPLGSRFINYVFLWEQVSWPLALRRDNISLVHCTFRPGPRICPCPKVLTLYDALPYTDIEGNPVPQKRTRGSRALSKADHIITTSNHSRQDLLRLFGNSLIPKVQVIPLAASEAFTRIKDQTLIHSVLKQYQIEKPFLLAFGHHDHPRKNIPRLFEAFEKFQQNSPESCQLFITGITRPQAVKTYSALIKDLNIENSVIFGQYVEEEHLPVLLSAAKFLIYPSLYEGFGIPPLDAMKCGCPVIASNRTSTPETVGNAALLINPMDTQEMADVMTRLYSDSELQKSLIQKGYERVQQFSWKHTAEQTLRVFEQVCS